MQTYQVEAAIQIQHQVLITNLQGDVQQPEGRINNQILGVKGLKASNLDFPKITTPQKKKQKKKQQGGKGRLRTPLINL